MKIQLMAALVAFGLIGANVQANDLNETADIVSDAVFKTLDHNGDLKGLDSTQLAGTKDLINQMVNDYLKDPSMDLSDSNVQYAWADTLRNILQKGTVILSKAAKAAVAAAQKLLPKIAAAVKKVAPKVLETLKTLATKGFETIKKYGPKVVKGVLEIGDALGLTPDVALGMAFAAGMNPVTPPGGAEGFFKALKREMLNSLAGTDVSEEDVKVAVKGKTEILKETNPELAEELEKFLEE